jgi:hypothetical protein
MTVAFLLPRVVQNFYLKVMTRTPECRCRSATQKNARAWVQCAFAQTTIRITSTNSMKISGKYSRGTRYQSGIKEDEIQWD